MKKHIFLGALLCLYASMPAWTQNKAFIQNVGQITDPQLQTRTDIDFKVSEQKGLQVFVGKGKLHYQWLDAEKTSDSTTLYHSYRLDMELVGSNKKPRLSYGAPQQAYERYFLSWVNMDNSNDGKVAHRYNSVTYHDVYPHIDWKLYFTPEGQLEYDFIVHPGGKVSDIQLVYQGADSLSLDPNGRLNIYTPKGQLIESAPYSYEEKSKKQIASEFKVMGNKVSFNNAAYIGTLVIDPIIEWGTYFGDQFYDGILSSTMDPSGNIYTVGNTNSLANIATNGSHQQTFGGGSFSSAGDDAFVSKWTNNGQLIWSTYYGGERIEQVKHIAINQLNEIVFIGYTNSATGIATVTGFQDTLNNANGSNYDIFIVAMDSAGVRNWGTYFGGNGNDGNTSTFLAIDGNNNIYITGNTASSNIWISNNAFKNLLTNGDAIVAKLDVQGNVLWSTYFGGNNNDIPTALTIDENGYFYLGGFTNSTSNFSYNAAQQATNGGSFDGFISKWDTSGSLLWNNYIGNTGIDRVLSITIVDTVLVIGGQTASTSGISTPNSFQTTYSNGIATAAFDGFLMHYNFSGIKLYGTYWGGANMDAELKIALADSSTYYVLMQTQSQSNIADTNALYPNFSGMTDIALGKFRLDGSKVWSTYIGGNQQEYSSNLVVGVNKQLIITGSSNSSNQIATVGAHQTALSGDYDGFLIKINDCDAPILTTSITGLDTLCPHTTALYTIPNIPNASSYHWLFPSGWQGQSDSNSIAVMVHGQSGTVSVYTQSACGGISDTVHMEVHVYPNRTISIQRQNNILRTTQVFPSYQWLMNGSPIVGATNSTYIPTSNGIYSLQVIDENGCVFVSDSIDIHHLSIHSVNNKSLTIYPNPTEGSIALDLPAAGTLQVVDVIGRTLQQHSLTTGKQNIDLSKLPAGTYTLLYTTAEGQYSGLVVKE